MKAVTFSLRAESCDTFSYRQDLVSLLESPIQRCSSIFFDFRHIYATVIHDILLIHAPNYVETQAWKMTNKNQKN